MAANKEFLMKNLKETRTIEERKLIKACQDCSVGLVVVYVCPRHLKEGE